MDYAALATKATATLADKGQTCRVRVYTDHGYVDDISQVSSSYTDTDVSGVLFDFFFGATNQTGTEIMKGDKRLYLAPTVTISQSQTVSILVDSIEYQVVGVCEINPAGTVVLYDLHMRR